MNIFYGKFGRTVMFDKKKWSTIGGDNEAPALLLKLASTHPEDTFYLISASDFSKFDKLREAYPNIVPLMDGYTMGLDDTSYLVQKVKARGLTFDYGIIYNGITSTNNIPGVTYMNKSLEIAKTKTLMFSERYCGPMVAFINHVKTRWCLLTPDPRYYPMQAKDIQCPPEVVWSQYNGKHDFLSRDYMTRNDTVHEIDMVYAEIETNFLFGKRKASLNQITKPRKHMMNIVLNEGGGASGGLARGPLLKEYVLDNFAGTEISDNIQIFGKWSDDWMADPRFKGCVRVEELFPLLSDTKYTFIIPIQPNWATAKFCEMSYYGILPFMHPIYDTQKNIKCPEYLRISSPAELKQKIAELEQNEEKRIALVKELWEMYGQEYFDGSKIIGHIYEHIANPVHKPVYKGIFNKGKRIS